MNIKPRSLLAAVVALSLAVPGMTSATAAVMATAIRVTGTVTSRVTAIKSSIVTGTTIAMTVVTGITIAMSIAIAISPTTTSRMTMTVRSC